MMRVSVKPDVWESEWSEKRNKAGIFTIGNFPKLAFVYHGSGLMTS